MLTWLPALLQVGQHRLPRKVTSGSTATPVATSWQDARDLVLSVLPKQHLGARLPRRPRSRRSTLQCRQKHKRLGYSFVLSSKQSPSQISAEMPQNNAKTRNFSSSCGQTSRTEKCLLIIITTRAFQFGTVKKTGLQLVGKGKPHFLVRQPQVRSPLG